MLWNVSLVYAALQASDTGRSRRRNFLVIASVLLLLGPLRRSQVGQPQTLAAIAQINFGHQHEDPQRAAPHTPRTGL